MVWPMLRVLLRKMLLVSKNSAVGVLATDHDGPALIVGVVVGEGVAEQMEVAQIDSHRAALADVVEAGGGAIGL